MQEQSQTSWVRAVGSAIVQFDRSKLEYGFALRCTLGVAVPLIVSAALGHASDGFAMAIGALVSGASSLQGVYRSRIAIVLGVGLGMAVASFLGALVAPSLPLLLVLTAAIGYAWGIAAQFGMPARVAGLNTTVAFIIFSSLPLTPAQDVHQSSLLFAGSVFQAALLLIAWPIDRATIERRALGAVYRDVAQVAASLASPSSAFPPIASLATARRILADPHPFAGARTVARLERLLNDAETLRSRIGAMLSVSGEETLEANKRLGEAVGAHLTRLAAALEQGETAGLDGRLPAETQAAFEAFEAANGGHALAVAVARDIAAALRDATRLVAVVATDRPAQLLFSAAPRPRDYVETTIDWLSRDAIRITVILTLAMWLGHTIFLRERGYWIALTAALVLRPDLHNTLVRGFARIGGTAAGAVLATLAEAATRGQTLVQSVTMVAAAAVAYVTLVPNYALFSAAITVFVVLALDVLGAPGHGTALERVLDTLVGGSLAMIGYLVFPSWGYQRTRPLLAKLIDAQRQFAVMLLDAYLDRARADTAAIDDIRTTCWKLRTEVEAAIDRSRLELQRPHTIAIPAALEALAASQSIALTNMALEAGLASLPPMALPPSMRAFRDALDRAMGEIAEAYRLNRPVRLGTELARAYEAMAADAPAFPDARFVIESAADYMRAAEALSLNS